MSAANRLARLILRDRDALDAMGLRGAGLVEATNACARSYARTGGLDFRAWLIVLRYLRRDTRTPAIRARAPEARELAHA